MAFQYKWRVRTRVVAYLGLVFTIISAILYSILYISVLTSNISEESLLLELDFYGFLINPYEDALWTIYGRAIISTFTSILYLWIGILLLKATKAEADPVQALRQCYIWLGVLSVDGVLWMIGMIYNEFFVEHPEDADYSIWEYILILAIFCAVFEVAFFIILKFIRELKQVVKGGNLHTVVVCKLQMDD